jgi:hypothetical protein
MEESDNSQPLICSWFQKLQTDLALLAAAEPLGPFPMSHGELLAEVLYDCANELFAAGLLATHLRRFGRDSDPLGHFWTRCEWCKFDISYGRAANRFDDWNKAWNRGETGDIGCLELKLLYSHFPTSATTDRVEELKRQMLERQTSTNGRCRLSARSDTSKPYRYDGLILFVGDDFSDNRTVCERTIQSAQLASLFPATGWTELVCLSADQIQSLFPRSDIMNSWKIHAKLVTLR